MKKLPIALFVLLVVASGSFIAACSDPVSSGIIVSKEHQPAREYEESDMILAGKVVMIDEYTAFDDEDYIFVLENCKTEDGKDKCRTGKIYVPAEIYSDYSEGDRITGDEFEFDTDDKIEKRN